MVWPHWSQTHPLHLAGRVYLHQPAAGVGECAAAVHSHPLRGGHVALWLDPCRDVDGGRYDSTFETRALDRFAHDGTGRWVRTGSGYWRLPFSNPGFYQSLLAL